MTRLTRSFRAYLRSMQMSRHGVFAFVEGKRADPYFYGEICRSVCGTSGISYEIRRSWELANGGGGKQTLISFFEYLRRKSALVDVFKGKGTGILFFLDKDVDDLLGRQRRSPHVVYTRYYDVENHIFTEADLIKAAAGAASLDRQEVLSCFADGEAWRCKVAAWWKEWVTLCLFVAKKKISCESNYGVPSRINNPAHGPVDQAAYRAHQKRIRSKLGFADPQFRRAFGRVARLVDGIYAQGEHDRLFKGKWYGPLLADTITDTMGSSRVDSAGLAKRLSDSVRMTLDFDAPWADYFKEPLRRVIREVKSLADSESLTVV
jgi:hypothetical protein